MKIILTEQDVLSVSASTVESISVPIEIIVQDGNITASFYSSLILELRKCDGEYRMFQFNNLEEYHSYDFSYFEDVEIIWNNFTDTD